MGDIGRSTALSLAVIGCHCFRSYTVIMLPLLSFSVEMTALPAARRVSITFRQNRFDGFNV
jgi:hypothetical protein